MTHRLSNLASVIPCLATLIAQPDCEARPSCTPPTGAPIVTQTHPSSPQLWCIEADGTNRWKLTVEAHAVEEPELCAGVNCCFPTHFDVQPTSSSHVVIISELIIIRPLDYRVGVSVQLGGLSTNQWPLESVEKIITDPQNEDDRDGYVKVVAELEGDLGEVTNVNYLFAKTFAGDVGTSTQSISCVMHPNAPSDPPSAPDCRLSGVNLESVTGSLLGDVIVAPAPETGVRGTIEQLRFIGGQIGADEETPVLIAADGAIGKVLGKQIHANIRGTSTDGEESYVHLLGSLETINYGSPAGTGEFTGEIRAENLGASDEYDLEKVTFRGRLVFAGPMRGRVWAQNVDTEFDYFHLAVQRDDFEGSVSLASLDDSAGASAWGAPVAVLPDSDIYDDPDDEDMDHIVFTANDVDGYTPARTAALLGGGTVGVVPFRLHADDCFPKHSEKIDPATFANYILMRHYGPVTWNTANGQPFEVSRRKAGSSDSWQAQTCVTCTPHATNSTIVVVSYGTPDEYAVGTFHRGFEYQVKLKTFNNGGTTENVLRSNLPHLSTANDPEVYDSAALVFQVCDATPAAALGDADDSGIVDSEDVDCVLANWSSTDCLKLGDANRDGAVNGTDLDIAELYLEWQYCYEAPSSFSNIADGFAQMDLDQDFGAMSEPMTVTQAVQWMGYDDTADFAAGYDAMEPAARAAARACLMALISGE